jgi:hypothetical protein
MKYKIVEEDRATEEATFHGELPHADVIGAEVIIKSDSGTLINWRYVRRLVPITEPAYPDLKGHDEAVNDAIANAPVPRPLPRPSGVEGSSFLFGPGGWR